MQNIILPRTDEAQAPDGSTAAQWAARWFGGPTQIRETRPVMGLTPSRIIPNNPRRVFWQVVNRSVNNVSFGFDNTVTTANGYPLAPSAGFASMAVQTDGEGVAYELIGIADVAPSSLVVFEVIRV